MMHDSQIKLELRDDKVVDFSKALEGALASPCSLLDRVYHRGGGLGNCRLSKESTMAYTGMYGEPKYSKCQVMPPIDYPNSHQTFVRILMVYHLVAPSDTIKSFMEFGWSIGTLMLQI